MRDLRKATENLAPAAPRLTRSFKVLNKFFNTLAYDPPGATEPFLFWSAIVLVGCSSYGSLVNAVLPGSPQLGTATQLLNLPPIQTACPNTPVVGIAP